MLLPETDRSRAPFVVSLTIQCSLVLLLAIPWTVETLESRASIRLPTFLDLRPLAPVEARTAPPSGAPARDSLQVPARVVRTFRIPSMNSNGANAVIGNAPEIGFDLGAPMALGEAGGLSDAAVLQVPVSAVTSPVPIAPEVKEQRVVVGGEVQAAKLIQRVQPIYPALAKQVRVQGVVTLEAIIGADGTIRQLHVLSGHPMLVPSAMQAVQQWKYSPTFLNGRAVEVKTTIEVRFTLLDR